jgi:hypothetical protein
MQDRCQKKRAGAAPAGPQKLPVFRISTAIPVDVDLFAVAFCPFANGMFKPTPTVSASAVFNPP